MLLLADGCRLPLATAVKQATAQETRVSPQLVFVMSCSSQLYAINIQVLLCIYGSSHFYVISKFHYIFVFCVRIIKNTLNNMNSEPSVEYLHQ